MKKFNALKITLLLSVLAVSVRAQQVEHLTANNVDAGIGIGGNLFSVIPDTIGINSTWTLFEAPKGSGIYSVATAAVWLTATDAANNTHCAAQRYKISDPGFADGPVATSYNSAYDQYYRRVFKVTRQQLDAHLTNTFPVSSAAVDPALKQWPAKGNADVLAQYGVSIDHPLAPFFDVNGDGIYSPENGDYPLICGNEAIFFVFNSARTSTDSFDFEIRGLAEEFAGNGVISPPVNNTVFVSYEVENKSNRAYNDFRLSLFEDVDLGCWLNDRAGCDTNLNLMFGYNGTDPDYDCNGLNGFGPLKAAHGVKFLNHRLAAFGYFTNGAPAAMGDPQVCDQYQNYSHANWADGTHFTHGGIGYNTGTATDFMFSGDPNNPQDWSEVQASVSQPPGDRRVFGTAALGNFAPGEVKHIDLAFTTVYDSTATMLTIVDTLKRDENIVQTFYNNQILSCRAAPTVSVNETAVDINVQIFPNPAHRSFTISGKTVINELSLFDAQGRLQMQKTNPVNNAQIDVSALPAGVYMLRLKAANGTIMKRLVIE